jgi:putative transcriptional regulator
MVEQMVEQLAPGLLIAAPQLLDPNFKKSVIVLFNKDEHGAMGVVINRESGLLLKDLCADHKIDFNRSDKQKVRSGGPVQPEHGIVLYSPDGLDLEGSPLCDGLSVSSSKETLAKLCGLPDVRFHCYAGYAGWAPDQLEEEFRQGSWITAPVDPELVLNEPLDTLWTRSLQSIGIDPTALVPGGQAES